MFKNIEQQKCFSNFIDVDDLKNWMYFSVEFT